MTEESRIPEFLSELETKLDRKAVMFIQPGQEDPLYQRVYHHVGQGKTCEDHDLSKIISQAPHRYTELETHYFLTVSGNSLVKNSDLREC
jgi:hypothetical protein